MAAKKKPTPCDKLKAQLKAAEGQLAEDVKKKRSARKIAHDQRVIDDIRSKMVAMGCV